jgi:hypothetical protein
MIQVFRKLTILTIRFKEVDHLTKVIDDNCKKQHGDRYVACTDICNSEGMPVAQEVALVAQTVSSVL